MRPPHWPYGFYGRVAHAASAGVQVGAAFGIIPLIGGVLGERVQNGVGPLHLALSFVVGGAVGGVAAGILLPLARWFIGSMLLGGIVGACGGLATELTLYGFAWRDRYVGYIMIFPALGCFIGPILRYRLRPISNDSKNGP